MGSSDFIHLHVHSAYSLAEGAIPVKSLIKLCLKKKIPAVAVTDTNNLFGAMEFATEAIKAGVQPIIGCQVALGLENHQLVLLCQTEIGYRNLCALVSKAFLDVEPNVPPHITWETLETYADGLICLTGGIKGSVGQYLLHNQNKDAETALKRLKKAFPERLYIELQRHGVLDEDRIEEALIDLAYKHDIPLVATNDCYFPAQEMHEAHDALLCIADGRYVTEETRRKVTPEHYFKTADEMRELFSDLPEAVDNTVVIAQRCSFLLQSVKALFPAFQTKEGRSETEELKVQAREGLEWRLENFVQGDAETAKIYRDRLEFELDVIIKMGFSGYFLICSDFIKWAKDNDIPVGPGRGSGAGSVVAWALKITDLDPIKLNLLFERFLNPERVSLPDFDVDFCQDRRDEVIRYVQNHYGRDRVAQIITFGQLKARAVVRDVGRVLQMPYGQVDRIAKMIPNNPANPITLAEALEQDEALRAERYKDDTSDKLITIALQLEGLYRHASTHAAGVVIGDRPLPELVPLYRDPSSDMPATQFNMKYVESTGLVKFDFLGLKTMTVIQKAVKLIKQSQGIDIDVLKIPLEDEKTFKILQEGKTVGVFQLESAGMRDTGRKMKIAKFEEIIALVALYRPGPMDNIPMYIDHKEGKKEIDYIHPKLQPYLLETYGIMVYQEQIMQAAQVLAGYTLGGADLLRRAMGKKIKAEMDAQRARFVEGCGTHSGINEKRANEIFDTIDKFAGYGFNKSHAAAYALISYWTAWLKANYPVEFMAASMTLDAGNTDKLAIFKQELQGMGIALLPPDINKSNPMFKVEGDSIRYALAALKGVGAGAMESLVAEREKNGVFKDLNDFVTRIDPKAMNRKQFEQLAAAGAFECLNPNRAQMIESAELLLRHAQTLAAEAATGQESLFGGGGQAQPLPPLPQVQDYDPLERLKREFDAVGFYLSAHPLDTKAAQLDRLGIVSMADVTAMLETRSAAVVDMAGVLIKKQVKVSQKSGKKFGVLQLSDATGVYEVMLFSELLAKAQNILNEGETLLLKVGAEQRDEQIRFTTQDIKKLDETLSRKTNEIRITLDSAAPLQQIKTLLNTEGDGHIKITLLAPLENNRTAEITLKCRHSVSPQARLAMMKAQGVARIEEL